MAEIEVVVGARFDVMTLAHQRGNLLLGLVDDFGGRRAAHDVVEPGLALDLLHHRRVRHQQVVVLILTRSRLPFHLQDAHDDAGLILHADGFADWILFSEQLIDNRLSQDADVVGTFHVNVGVHAAAHDVPGLQR